MCPHPITHESNAYVIHSTCIVCRTTHDLTVPIDDYLALSTNHIQDAMPSLSADDRKILISGICGPCFDSQFEETQ